jgi:cell division initiation protein
MKITPIDIRQQQFAKTFRGLSPKEVDSFLNLVSDEMESLHRENNKLKEEMSQTRQVVDEYRDREKALKETMITAQKITNDIKEGARKEAEVILSQAELQAEKIVHAANDRLLKVIEEINEMKRQRDQLHSTLMGQIEAYRKHLREVEEQKLETSFLQVEELKARRISLAASIRELLETQASLLGMDRDRQIEELREESERLNNLRINLKSALDSTLEGHHKLLLAHQETEAGQEGFHLEENVKVLRWPESAKSEAHAGMEAALRSRAKEPAENR